MYFKDLTFNSTNLNTSLLLLVFCVLLYACMCVHVFLDACLPVSLLVSARGITWVGSISILLQGFWFHYRSQKGQEMRGNVQGNERENACNVAAKWHNNLTNHLSLFCVCVLYMFLLDLRSWGKEAFESGSHLHHGNKDAPFVFQTWMIISCCWMASLSGLYKDTQWIDCVSLIY